MRSPSRTVQNQVINPVYCNAPPASDAAESRAEPRAENQYTVYCTGSGITHTCRASRLRALPRVTSQQLYGPRWHVLAPAPPRVKSRERSRRARASHLASDLAAL